jgi:IclR family acetate operon transcriptional repressor
MLILDEVMGSYVLGNAQSLGTRWPLHATSTGKAVLAALPAAQRSRLLPGRLARLTEHTITQSAALRRDLERVAEQGYATAVEELELGFVAVGAPVRNFEGRVLGAISIGGPTVRLTAARLPTLGQAVRDAAADVSRRLGY